MKKKAEARQNAAFIAPARDRGGGVRVVAGMGLETQRLFVWSDRFHAVGSMFFYVIISDCSQKQETEQRVCQYVCARAPKTKVLL